MAKMLAINCMPDHTHLFVGFKPTFCISDFVKEIKVATSLWMKDSGYYPEFVGWAEGYGAFTYAYRDKALIMNYIKNQCSLHCT